MRVLRRRNPTQVPAKDNEKLRWLDLLVNGKGTGELQHTLQIVSLAQILLILG